MMIRIVGILIVFMTLMSAGYGAENTKLTVLLDWFANPNHAPLFVAEEKGFFKNQGIDIEFIGPSDPADPPKLVAARQADIAITYETQFMEQVDQGLPLIRIGTLIAQPLNCIVTLKAGSIKTVNDLKGKRVGYSTGGVTHVTLKTMLENNGLTLSDITSINVHYNLTQALLSGKVDAITGMMRNFELIQMELAGHPATVFYPENAGVPLYSELILVAHKDNIRDPKFRKFLIALTQGINYLKKHPDETWQRFSKFHLELNDELNRRAWFMTIPYFALDPEKINENQWRNFADYLYKNAVIKKIQPVNTYSINLLKE